MSTPLRFCSLTMILLGLGLGLTAGAGCKKKPPRLTKNECERFCKRLVPCFAEKMANFSMKQDEDIRECIQNCTSKEAAQHAQLLRAMKKCGDLKDCGKLRKCFAKTL